MIVVAALLFIIAAAGWSAFAIQRTQMKWRLIAARTTLDSANKVGKWYEDRVRELENETRQLAEQVLIAGAIPKHAMPIPPAADDAEYAYDPTGLVRDRLEPRDAPIGL